MIGTFGIFEFLGTGGSLILCASAVPQIVKTFRTRSAKDLSIAYLLVLLLGILMMTVYSLHIGDAIFIFANGLSLAATVVLIALWLRYGWEKTGKN